MAELTLAALRKRPGRIETFVNKMKNRSPFAMVNGDQKIITRVGFTDRSGRITEFTPGKDPRQYQQAIEWLRSRASTNNSVILMNDKERFSLKEFLKSSEFGSTGGKKGNRGDMAEAIFAIAITCRFMNKNNVVSEQDVLKIISSLDKTRPKQVFEYKSPNKNKKIEDVVIFTLNLATSNLTALTDRTTLSSLNDIIQSSVMYANSSVVSSWSKLLYENNKFNKIDVMSIGTVSQTETKVDVLVKVDDKPIDINVSLKADDVKQFGQVGGSGFDKQLLLWKNLFGLDVSKHEKKYNDALKNGGSFMEAIGEVYRGVVDDINASLKARKTVTYSNISKGIRYYATLNQESVTLVQLNRQEAVVYSFDNLEKLLSITNLQAKYIASKANPEITLVDNRGKALFNVRCRRDGNYIRNVIEKGSLLTELASYTIA